MELSFLKTATICAFVATGMSDIAYLLVESVIVHCTGQRTAVYSTGLVLLLNPGFSNDCIQMVARTLGKSSNSGTIDLYSTIMYKLYSTIQYVVLCECTVVLDCTQCSAYVPYRKIGSSVDQNPGF